MEKPLISVIVPVYNVEKYLDRCVESIVNQTYENLEIILVDDGSSDHCPQICDNFSVKDNRIKVIHKENGGAGSARNAGIDNSSGEWIAFVDGDDTIDENFYDVLMTEALKNNVDICACDFKYYHSDGTFTTENYFDAPHIFSSNELLAEFFDYCKGEWVSFCNKIIKKDLLNDFRFPEKCYFEDWQMAPVLYSRADKTMYLPQYMYNYYYRDDSAVHTYSVKRYSDCVIADVFHYNYFNKRNIRDYNEKIKAFMISDFKKCIKVYTPEDKMLLKKTYEMCFPILNSRLVKLLAAFPSLFHYIYLFLRKVK